MNEPGIPVSPPASPPSYLRPPATSPSPFSHSGPKTGLLIVATLAAVIAISVLAYIYSPFATNKTSLSGALVFYVQTPTPGVYTYDFATQEVAQIDVAGAIEGLSPQWTSFSPHADFYVQHAIRAKDDAPLLIVGNPRSGATHYLGSSDAEVRFDWPVVSNDGTHVAYVLHSSILMAKTKAELLKGKGERVINTVLAYASLENGVLTPHNLNVEGVPAFFSQDNSTLLVRQPNKFILITLDGAKVQNLTDLPSFNSDDTVQTTLSEDGETVALAVGDTVYWGELNWSTGAFLERGSFNKSVDALRFGRGDDLLFADQNGLGIYNLRNKKTQDITTPEEFNTEPGMSFTVFSE